MCITAWEGSTAPIHIYTHKDRNTFSYLCIAHSWWPGHLSKVSWCSKHRSHDQRQMWIWHKIWVVYVNIWCTKADRGYKEPLIWLWEPLKQTESVLWVHLGVRMSNVQYINSHLLSLLYHIPLSHISHTPEWYHYHQHPHIPFGKDTRDNAASHRRDVDATRVPLFFFPQRTRAQMQRLSRPQGRNLISRQNKCLYFRPRPDN